MLSSRWVPVIAPYQNSEPDGGRSKVMSSATKDQWMCNLVGGKLFILVVPLASGGQLTSDLTRSTGCPINPAVNRESEPITTGPAAYTSHLAALKKEVSPQILPAFPSCFPKHLSSRWLGCLWRKIPHLYIIVCLLTGGSRAFTADRKHLFWPSALKNLVQVKSDWSCSSVTKGYQYLGWFYGIFVDDYQKHVLMSSNAISIFYQILSTTQCGNCPFALNWQKQAYNDNQQLTHAN